MSKDLKYFKKFLENPTSYNNREFNEFVKHWVDYITEHKDEFDYLNDDDWEEVRERLIEEIDCREDAREDLDEINEQFQVCKNKSYKERIELHQKWIAFMKRNQFNYEFSDEDIAEEEKNLENSIRADREVTVAEENLRISKIESRKSLAKLDDKLAEYYESTGKIPVLNALQFKKKFDGN